MNIWESQLIQPAHEIQNGFLRVPEGAGLGVAIDEAALERYCVDYTFVHPPRHLYRYTRAGGESRYYACSKEQLQWAYPGDAQPVCEAGSSLTVVADDGSQTFADLYAAVKAGQTYSDGNINTFGKFHNVLTQQKN